MKRTVFVLMIILLWIPFYAYGQIPITVKETDETGKVKTKRYTNWMRCGRENVAVDDQPSFTQDGVEAYSSAFDYLIFKLEDGSTSCVRIGFGWRYDGFEYGIRKETGQETLLFKLGGGDGDRYADVRKGELLFRVSKAGEDLTVSSEPLQEPGKGVKVIRDWIGSKSKVMKRFYYRIDSKEEWRDIWSKHSDDPVPQVDFATQMIIAVFIGRSVNTNGVFIQNIREMDDSVRLRFKIGGYQAMNANQSSPYGIFVLPKIEKTFRLEESIQRFIGGPAKWQQRMELPVEN